MCYPSVASLCRHWFDLLSRNSLSPFLEKLLVSPSTPFIFRRIHCFDDIQRPARPGILIIFSVFFFSKYVFLSALEVSISWFCWCCLFFIHYVMEFSIFHASIHFHFCMIAFFDIFPHLDFIDLGSLKFITFHKIWVLLFLVNLVLTGFHFFLLCFFSGFVFNVLNFLWFSSTCNLQMSLL